MANDLRLHLDDRDCRQKAIQTRQEEGATPQPKGRPHAQGTGLPTAKAEHVRRSAEGTKFGYRTSNGPIPAPKHLAESANASSSNRTLPRTDRAVQPSWAAGATLAPRPLHWIQHHFQLLLLLRLRHWAWWKEKTCIGDYHHPWTIRGVHPGWRRQITAATQQTSSTSSPLQSPESWPDPWHIWSDQPCRWTVHGTSDGHGLLDVNYRVAHSNSSNSSSSMRRTC